MNVAPSPGAESTVRVPCVPRRSRAQPRARAPIPVARCPTEHRARRSAPARRRESRDRGRLPRAAPSSPLTAHVPAPPSRTRRTGAHSTRGCRAPAAAGGDRLGADGRPASTCARTFPPPSTRQPTTSSTRRPTSTSSSRTDDTITSSSRRSIPRQAAIASSTSGRRSAASTRFARVVSAMARSAATGLRTS